MNPTKRELLERFGSQSRDELVANYLWGGLTETAKAAILDTLVARQAAESPEAAHEAILEANPGWFGWPDEFVLQDDRLLVRDAVDFPEVCLKTGVESIENRRIELPAFYRSRRRVVGVLVLFGVPLPWLEREPILKSVIKGSLAPEYSTGDMRLSLQPVHERPTRWLEGLERPFLEGLERHAGKPVVWPSAGEANSSQPTSTQEFREQELREAVPAFPGLASGRVVGVAILVLAGLMAIFNQPVAQDLWVDTKCFWSSQACFEDALAIDSDGQQERHERRRQLLTRGCEAHDATCCYALGSLESGMYEPAFEDLPAAERAFKASCDEGSIRGCARYGWGLWPGRGDRQDAVRARKVLENACSGGSQLGCLGLAEILRSSEAGEPDRPRARQLARRTCDSRMEWAPSAGKGTPFGDHFSSTPGGRFEGCVTLAEMLREGEGGSHDAEAARKLSRQACYNGNMGGCGLLAAMLRKGEGGAKDEEGARRLFKQACDGGEMRACATLGFMLSEGEGGAKDEQDARRLLKQACDGGDMWACGHLGVMLLKGAGGAKDEQGARNLVKLACDGGEMASCGNLGVMLSKGLGGAKDEQGARRLVKQVKQACDGGEMASCGFLDFMLSNGAGGAIDE